MFKYKIEITKLYIHKSDASSRTQSLQTYVTRNVKNTFDWRHCGESVDVTPEGDTFCKAGTICRDSCSGADRMWKMMAMAAVEP